MHIEILIKKVRNEKNATLTTISRKSGVSISHLSDIENERKNESSLPDLSCGFKSRLPSKPLLLLLHHSPCSLSYSHTASKT